VKDESGISAYCPLVLSPVLFTTGRYTVNDGVPIMYHFEVETDEELEWKGRSANMFVRQGNYQGSTIFSP
jgi:hypothetical protein